MRSSAVLAATILLGAGILAPTIVSTTNPSPPGLRQSMNWICAHDGTAPAAQDCADGRGR